MAGGEETWISAPKLVPIHLVGVAVSQDGSGNVDLLVALEEKSGLILWGLQMSLSNLTAVHVIV